ncbi:MAG: sugar phosphate isomerase/epimerase, partial [Verrucomicrobiales bacterium]|nr:sugar phosphate isomerase/epimerase [Verrucomicrobiales bacterium]
AALRAGGLGHVAGATAEPPHLSTNSYSWHVFYQRDGRDFGAELESGLAEVKGCGIDGFEPGVGGPEDVRRMIPRLEKAGLQMRSLYVNSTLHDEAEAAKSIENIVEVARATRPLGTRIFVTNPNPIQWGGAANKDDAQLKVQAAAMNRLGAALKAHGVTLAYHNHDIELRNAGREFHHMMLGTDPALVSLCLDSHWVFRGSGNSQVALFDIVKLYGARVVELHLRQSRDGVWSETLDAGDIDHERLASELRKAGAKPHLVLEVAVEKGTPKTMSPAEAHRRSAAYARSVFA